jgi:prepilin-type N-terminal cleavage/methylation domain-containing protein
MRCATATSTISVRRLRFPGRPGRAFTLIEIMIVIAILALLAAILIANVTNLLGFGRSETLSSTVSHVRRLVEYRAASGEPPLAASGYPPEIDAQWFTKGQLPVHTWTRRPMRIETVDAGADALYPVVKTFDTDDAAAFNAWYNVDNGAFCVRVSNEHAGADLLEQFNTANTASITDPGQTQ